MTELNTKLRYVVLVSLFFSLVSLIQVKCTYATQTDEQKKLTKTEYYGDFSKAKKTRTSGKITLTIWEPYLQHMQRIGAGNIIPVTNLSVYCDEIWEKKATQLVSKEEVKKYWNELDIYKLYWKNGKVQASTVLKRYVSNPITNQRLPKPEYKITAIETREEVFKQIH
jgi:hypothetical protein